MFHAMTVCITAGPNVTRSADSSSYWIYSHEPDKFFGRVFPLQLNDTLKAVHTQVCSTRGSPGFPSKDHIRQCW